MSFKEKYGVVTVRTYNGYVRQYSSVVDLVLLIGERRLQNIGNKPLAYYNELRDVNRRYLAFDIFAVLNIKPYIGDAIIVTDMYGLRISAETLRHVFYSLPKEERIHPWDRAHHNYKFRVGSVPYTGGRRYVSWYRTYHTFNERRTNLSFEVDRKEENKISGRVRMDIPDDRSEWGRASHKNRNWKQFRKTQYR